jgi:hypothetical protein
MQDPTEILENYTLATELDPEWYQAWHIWSLANFDVITKLELTEMGLVPEHFTTYIIPACEGEFSWQAGADIRFPTVYCSFAGQLAAGHAEALDSVVHLWVSARCQSGHLDWPGQRQCRCLARGYSSGMWC